MFDWTDSLNKIDSWETIPICDLNDLRLTLLISKLSIKILPESGLINLGINFNKVLFPDPLSPTIPTNDFSLIFSDMFEIIAGWFFWNL